jgi:hypothetical protein
MSVPLIPCAALAWCDYLELRPLGNYTKKAVECNAFPHEQPVIRFQSPRESGGVVICLPDDLTGISFVRSSLKLS